MLQFLVNNMAIGFLKLLKVRSTFTLEQSFPNSFIQNTSFKEFKYAIAPSTHLRPFFRSSSAT